MTTMQKFKAYFGMVPPTEYEDDYLTDPMSADARGAYDDPRPGRRDDQMSARERLYIERYRGGVADEPFYDDDPYEVEYAEVGYAQRGDARVYAERSVHAELDRGPVSAPVRSARLEPLSRSSNLSARGPAMPVRGATALAPEPRPEILAESAGRISTLRPADYSEARTIGERFRDGNPVIMDLVDMSNDDAKRMVDFAAGLVFALRGSFDKVATKVFLLSPAGVEVTPEDRRRLAETGFHNQD